MGSAFVELVRKTIEEYIIRGKTISAPDPLPCEMSEKAGVFVSLHKHGALRGCIGTFLPTTDNIAEEIISMAIEASIADLRFAPIHVSEIKDLDISVDVLGTPEEIPNKSYLDPKIYGVIVTSGRKRGLLLPDLEGVYTAEEQISISMRKASIHPGEPIKLQRFKVTRHH